MDNVVSQYVFGCIDNNKEIWKEILQTRKMGSFLEGVKLKALGRWEGFELVEKRKYIFGMEWHEQKPKVESGI